MDKLYFMKYFILFFVMVLMPAKSILACSCGPYEDDFYKVVNNNHKIVFGIVEKIDFSYEYNGLHAYTMYLSVTDTMAGSGTLPGRTVVVTGQDGLNCGETMFGWSSGMKMVLALERGFYYEYGQDTFYLNGCGKHYDFYSEDGIIAPTIDFIKNKIRSAITSTHEGYDVPEVPLYPNPASDQLFMEDPIWKIRFYTIMGYDGRIIRKTEVLKRSKHEINIQDLNPGMYLISFWDGETFQNFRFFKQ
jgi:hypothetical protein